jgi:hypothetical protein
MTTKLPFYLCSRARLSDTIIEGKISESVCVFPDKKTNECNIECKKNYGGSCGEYTENTLKLQKQISLLMDEKKDLTHENEKLKTLVETNKKLYESELKNKNLQIEIYKLKMS